MQTNILQLPRISELDIENKNGQISFSYNGVQLYAYFSALDNQTQYWVVRDGYDNQYQNLIAYLIRGYTQYEEYMANPYFYGKKDDGRVQAAKKRCIIDLVCQLLPLYEGPSDMVVQGKISTIKPVNNLLLQFYIHVKTEIKQDQQKLFAKFVKVDLEYKHDDQFKMQYLEFIRHHSKDFSYKQIVDIFCQFAYIKSEGKRDFASRVIQSRIQDKRFIPAIGNFQYEEKQLWDLFVTTLGDRGLTAEQKFYQLSYILFFNFTPNQRIYSDQILSKALENKCYDFARVLVFWGANVNEYNLNKQTPLHQVCYDGLVNQTVDAYTLRDMATEEKYQASHELFVTLLRFGANVNAKNNRDFTALHFLTFNYNNSPYKLSTRLEDIKLLIKCGADWDIRTDKYDKAFSYQQIIELSDNSLQNRWQILSTIFCLPLSYFSSYLIPGYIGALAMSYLARNDISPETHQLLTANELHKKQTCQRRDYIGLDEVEIYTPKEILVSYQPDKDVNNPAVQVPFIQQVWQGYI